MSEEEKTPEQGWLPRFKKEHAGGDLVAPVLHEDPVEEIVMTTDEEYEQIEEIRGSCPKCGGPLEFREHIEFFNKEINRDPYCPSCKLFWRGLTLFDG